MKDEIMKNFKLVFLNKKFFLLVFYYSLFVALSSFILWRLVNLFPYLDTSVLSFFVSHRSETLTAFFLFMTNFGSKYIILPLALIMFFYLFFKKRYGAEWLLLFASFGAFFEVYILKHLFARLRPDQSLMIVLEDSFSFPSGHAMAAVVFYGLIVYFLFLKTKKRWERTLAVILALFVIFSVAVSRLYLGVHWFFDVFTSLILGSGFLYTLISIHKNFLRLKYGKKENMPK